MGVVYRAKDLTLGRAVALKTLPATSPEDSARLRREARAMAAITHPNLALIFGVETWQGTPILVIEYLAGSTLAERLPTGPMAWEEVLELSLVLASVLERVHGSGILHRDVKPSNIGFTEEDVPKLLDFGLVRISAGIGAQQGTAEGHVERGAHPFVGDIGEYDANFSTPKFDEIIKVPRGLTGRTPGGCEIPAAQIGGFLRKQAGLHTPGQRQFLAPHPDRFDRPGGLAVCF